MYFASKYALKALILLGAVAVVYMKGPRFISPPKKNYTVLEGSKVKLKCAVTGANDPIHNRTLTAWRKIGIPFRHSIIQKTRNWDRFKVKNGKFLRIRNVKKQDAGLYLCIAKNQHGMIKVSIKLEVLPRPDVPSTNISHHVTTVLHTQNPEPTVAFKAPRFHNKQTIHAIKRIQGKLLRLPCNATGTPRPKIRWRKNNDNIRKRKIRKRVRISQWTLSIRRLKVSDSGIYQCIVWNRHGHVTRTFFLQVIGKDLQDHPREPFSSQPDRPKPIIQKHLLKNATIFEGQTVTFSCTAFSHEVPKFTWLKWTTFDQSNNMTVKVTVLNSSTPNVRFVRESTRKTGGKIYYSHKLKLLNVSKADQGQYTCVVGSTGEIVSAHVYLTVHLKRQKNSKEEPQTKSTAQPPNSLEGIPIPLAALIAVPAALLTLLIVAIIWCYIQIVKHRKQLHEKAATYRPAANGMAMNESYAAPAALSYRVPMETFTNGHVIHEPRPGMEMTNVPQVSHQLEMAYSPEVTHEPEVTQVMETLENTECIQDNAFSEFPVPPESQLQQNPNILAGASADKESTSPRCHGNANDNTSELNAPQTDNHTDIIRTPENTCEVVQDCSRNYSNDQCYETRTADVTCVNFESRDNVQCVDQYGVKNSDV